MNKILNKSIPTIQTSDTLGVCCDNALYVSLCVLIFVLPASIALLSVFVALTIFFYFLKKINRILREWASRKDPSSIARNLLFICNGLGPIDNVLNRPLQFLTMAVFISVVFSQYPGLSLSAFFGKFLKVVFLYFSFIETFRDQKRLQVFVNFLLAAASLAVLNGFIQHYAGINLVKGCQISGGRINSFFGTANGLGAYLLPVIGLVIHLQFRAIVHQKSWVLGGVLAVFLCSLLACLCWSYSRSSWVGLLIILLAMVFLDRRKVFFLLVYLLLFIFMFLPSLTHVRHLHLTNDVSTSVVEKENALEKFKSVLNQGPLPALKNALKQGGSGRFYFWKKAVSIIRVSPITGEGLNTYTRVLMKDPDHKTLWYAHNSYLQMAAETGLLGLACFLWLLFAVLSYSFNYCQQSADSWSRTLVQGALSGLIGLLVQSFFDNTFFVAQLIAFIWLIFGLLVAGSRQNENG